MEAHDAMKRLLLRGLTVLLALGLAAALGYVGVYVYTTKRTDARTGALAVQVMQRRAGAPQTAMPATPPASTASLQPGSYAAAQETVPPTVQPTDLPTTAATVTAHPSARPTQEAGTAEPPLATAAEEDPLLACYRTLAKENPDMVGWIHIPDTPVDYPVMYTPLDPQYYLYRDFDRLRTLEGIPFLDSRCDADAPTDNLIIYGHNMRSQRMFGSLHRYREEEYRTAHPLISFDTLQERRIYRVYAGFVVRLESSVEAESMMCYRVQLTSDREQLAALLSYAARYALFVEQDAQPAPGDQLLTLSTCNGGGKPERFVVMAVRVQ